MDVNLTISLMRGQMGVVIEKAVNAAVETVLGEMIRVVSVKLEELRREMTAKEKENQNMRSMLEMSRCQLKAMRKYVTALSAKEARAPAAAAAALPAQHRVTQRGGPLRAAPNTRTPEAAWGKQHAAPAPQLLQDSVSAEDYTRSQIYNEEMRESMRVVAEDTNAVAKESEGLVAESSDPLWGQTPPTSKEAEHTETLSSSLLPMTDTREVFNTSSTDCGGPSFKVKQEDAEVEIVRVKEEPTETINSSTSECPRIELGQQTTELGAGISLETSVAQQCHQIPCPTVTEPAFMGMDPNTCLHVRKYEELRTRRIDAESQLAMASAQRQVRPWCRDLNLYEEYKRKRIEVRRRSETRRRELEQTLPQALLADLVKERREKTRLRVARWRAKRKLQACLMSQAAQFNGAPAQALLAQRCGRRPAGVAAQQGGFTMGRVHSESGAYTLPLQMGSSPLLAAQRLGVAEGSSVFTQQRTQAADPETFQ